MSGRFVFVGALLALLHVRPLFAADQTEYLKKLPRVLPSTVHIATTDVTYNQVRQLMEAAFSESGDIDDPEFYCVVHILEYGNDPSTVANSRWYLYRGRGSIGTAGGRWTTERFRGTRVYGADQLHVAYVHLNVPAKATATLKADQLAAVGGTAMSTRSVALFNLGSVVVEKDYLGVAYQIDVTKKVPAPIQNLQEAVSLLQAEAAGAIALDEKVALHAAAEFDIEHVPSDITISGKLTFGPDLAKKTTELGKQTYDNEGLYRWDVSLGLPLRSVKELDFETSGGGVFVKEVERTQLMAFLNIFVRPVDTKNVRYMTFPRPIVGVALSKKPLERIFVGGSVGLNKVQFFAGRQWSQIKTAPEPRSAGSEQTKGAIEYEQNWMFGINVPVRQVVDFLKAKKMTTPHRDYVSAVRAFAPALKRRSRSSRRSPAQRKDLKAALAWNTSGNVVGFGVGPKHVDGKPDHSTKSVIVFVVRKVGRRKVPAAERIPARVWVQTIERTLQTDVIEVGSIPQLQASATLQPGTNAAHFAMRNGTLTAAVQTRSVPRQILLLSCCHGFAPPGFAGRQIESPPDASADTITNWVADLSDFEPLRPGGTLANRVDAALAIPHGDMIPRTSNNVPGLGAFVSSSPLHSGEFAANGIRQFAGVGAITPRVRGSLVAENVATLLADSFGRVFFFRDIVAYDPVPLTQPGDSGMPLFVRVPLGLQLIGLHIGLGQIAGTHRGAAFFVPIVDVLDRFKVDLIV